MHFRICFDSLHTNRARNGVDVGEDVQLKGRYNIDHVANALVIPKPDEKDAGKYTCSVPELKESADFDVVGKCFEIDDHHHGFCLSHKNVSLQFSSR